MKKLWYFIVASGLFVPSLQAGESDSLLRISIPEVRLVQSRGSFYAEDRKVTTIQSAILKKNRTASLGNLLQNASAFSIRTYGGEGNLSTIALRGTASRHTQVNWNGVPLNSTTAGDVDLSLIPVCHIQQLAVVHGASGSLYGSGTFGGAIEISTLGETEKGLGLSLLSETGSFGFFQNQFSIQGGTGKIFSSSSFLLNKSRNDFPYRDIFLPGSPGLKQQHNEMLSQGFYQQLSFRPAPGHRIDAGIWYQVRDKNLPEIMGSLGNSIAMQKDSSLKGFFKYTRTFSSASLIVKTAWLSNFLRYTDKDQEEDIDYSVYSEIHTRQWFSDVSYRYYINEFFTWDAAMVFTKDWANGTSFLNTLEELNGALLSALKFRREPWIFNGSMRLELLPSGKWILLPSLGVLADVGSDNLKWKLNVSQKYRRPTFNERYWQPGGNPDIKPEKGWSVESGIQPVICQTGSYCLSLDITGYSSLVQDYIQWVGEGLISSPQNVSKVWSRGLETSVLQNIKYGKVEGNIRLDYNLTRVTAMDEMKFLISGGRQLRYVPIHRISLQNDMEVGQVNLGWSGIFSSESFISENNGNSLPAYFLMNTWISKSFKWRASVFGIQFQANNLFNKPYRLMNSFPMPGRNFNLRATFDFNR